MPVELVRKTALRAQWLFPLINPEVDILHIDGGHAEENALEDVRVYVPLVRKGGYVWFDDSNWPSTQAAMRKLEETCRLENDQGTYRLYRKC